MRIRATDINGDWTFGAGPNNYVTANLAAAQLINENLSSFLGDCFFDSGKGINWFGFLGAKDQTGLNLAVSATILNTTDESGNQIVTGINQLSIVLNRATRNITIQYQVVTIYSTITGFFTYDLGGSA